jgi:hypothetical protein
MAILNSNGIVLVTSIPTWTPAGDDATLARLQNTNTFWYWNGSAWTVFIASTVAANDGLEVSGGNVKLGDNAEGTSEPGVFTASRFLNQNGFSLVHAVDDRVATGDSTGKTVRKILSLESGSADSFNEVIGTNNNAGVGADNNFTYYRSFNLDETGTLIDPTKHGWGDGYEFWYEPVAGEVYAEKHTILNIGGTTYRIDSHTLEIADPASWNLYHTLNTWFLKSSVDAGQFFEIERSTNQITNLKLYASSLVQRGASLQMTHDGTNVSLQITPFGAATGKTLTASAWDEAQLPSLNSYNTPGDPNGKLTFVFDRLYPNTDNDCELGADSFRYKQIHGASLKISEGATPADVTIEVTTGGRIITATLPVYANEAAAVVGGIATGTWYQTATGELRIKL